MQAHWHKLIHDTEARTETFLRLQNREPGHPDEGSFTLEFGYPDPKPTLFLAAAAVSVYLCPDSRYYHSPEIPGAVDAALRYAEGVQNPDGSFDYRPCNFASAPDTAFILHRQVVMRDLIVKSGDKTLAPFVARVDALLVSAAPAMASLGFHTPNHRWAIAAALSSVARVTGDQRWNAEADRYLLEGIDGNEDGEYAERSAGGYNAVNNDALLVLARERQDRRFLAYVDRNLEMMLTYIDPDGSIFTNNSTRQDRGVKVYPDGYFSNYLLAGQALGKPKYAAKAREILEQAVRTGRPSGDALDIVMLYFGALDYGSPLPELPTSYEKLYAGSGIARLRRGDWSVSLLKGSGRFLYFQSGALTASLKLGVGYFEHREFKPASLTKDGDAYVLAMEAKGWYYLPFPEAPATSDWWAMDHKKRPMASGPNLRFTVRVSVNAAGDGVDVAIDAGGWKGVPLRFEVALTPAGHVDSDAFEVEARPEEVLLAKQGLVRLRSRTDVLAFGPGFAEHRNVGGTYGSEGRSRDHFTVYFTGFTPLNRTLTFRRAPAREGL